MNQELNKVLDRISTLRVDKTGEFANPDLQIVTAVILMYIAKSDSKINQPELEALQRSLGRHFHLPDEDSAHVIEVADYLLRNKGQIKDFSERINNSFEESQRRVLLGLLWKIMSADGLVSTLEAKAAMEVVSLLKLTMEDMTEAKSLVASGKI